MDSLQSDVSFLCFRKVFDLYSSDCGSRATTASGGAFDEPIGTVRAMRLQYLRRNRDHNASHLLVCSGEVIVTVLIVFDRKHDVDVLSRFVSEVADRP